MCLIGAVCRVGKYEKTLKDTYPYIYAYDVTGVEDAAVPAWLETIQGLRYLVDCNAHAAIVMPSKDKKYLVILLYLRI